MRKITNDSNFVIEYSKVKSEARFNFEEFSLQFCLSLICFFKNNFSYIQEYDFIEGTTTPNDFVATMLGDIDKGLDYICQISWIGNEEITKASSDFWNWFAFKICFLKEKNAEPEFLDQILALDNNIANYVLFTNSTFFYRNLYSKILTNVRFILISKMTKPMEIKIEVDECGEIFVEQITNTIWSALHETMKQSLIYLTNLDPAAVERLMVDMLQEQSVEEKWNPSLLNSICWSIGAISGSMYEEIEKKFLVLVIKILLGLCESKKGKSNKAIVASNIMFVVGQYPRFLNSHWKFLKTVVKKLFEFMHEFHPGVQAN